MKHLIALTSLILLFTRYADAECSFDQDNQLSVIAAIDKKFPGGKVNLDQRQIIWSTASNVTTTFGFGGCEDFGSTVARSTPMAKPRTQQQVFALAHELSMRFWSEEPVSERLVTDALADAILHSRYTVERDGSRTTFNFNHPGFVQLNIQHEYAEAIDRVVVVWQGAF